MSKAGRQTGGLEEILNDQRLRHVSGELKALVRNCIRAESVPLNADLPIGASRLGGRPDLPPDVTWPTGKINCSPPTDAFRRDHPDDNYAPADGVVSLPFVAQINLSEASEFDRDQMLPKQGLLLFFYDARTFPSDTDIRRGSSTKETWLNPSLSTVPASVLYRAELLRAATFVPASANDKILQ